MSGIGDVLKAVIAADLLSRTAADVVTANSDRADLAFLTTNNCPLFLYKSASFLLTGQDNYANFADLITLRFGENNMSAEMGIDIAELSEDSIETPRESFNSDDTGADHALVSILCRLQAPITDEQAEITEQLFLRIRYLIGRRERNKRWQYADTESFPPTPGGYDPVIDTSGLSKNLDPTYGLTMRWVKNLSINSLECMSLYRADYTVVFAQ